MNPLTKYMLAALVAGASFSGCGFNDKVDANPFPGTSDAGAFGQDANTDAPVQDDATVQDSAEEPEAGAVIRTVIQRSPLGRLDPENLMLDGDFEMSGMDSMQYVWFGMEQRYVTTGAKCHSGVRCIRLAGNQYVAGSFMWPVSRWMNVRFYARPAEDDSCKDAVAGAIVMLDGYGGTQISIPSVGEDRENGWCRYERTVSAPRDVGHHLWGLVLAARPGISARVVFDDVVARGAGQPGFGTRHLVGTAPATKKLIDEAVDSLRRKLPGAPVPAPTPVRDMTGRRRFYRR